MSAEFTDQDGPALARALILGHALVVGGRRLRFEEVEAYLFAPDAPDPFAHRHPGQSRPGRWYFHRAGESYRGGSFKGLDITFGPEGTFGGLLIRTLSDGDRWVVGPSKCVDHLLALTGRRHPRELDDGRAVRDPDGVLRLVDAPREAPLLRTARVGLTLKRAAPGDLRPQYLLRPDRWLTDPRRIAKGRVHAVMALHQAGLDAAAIRERTGSTAVNRYLARYRAGQRDPRFERFFDAELSAGDYAELHGIWWIRYGSATIGR